jgi:hypothetical protein
MTTNTPTTDIRRYVNAAYTMMMRGKWDVAADLFNCAHLKCLVMAAQPGQDVPAAGALVSEFRELAQEEDHVAQ